MEKNKEILIFGADAIGRGFLAPQFYKKNYSISFVDNNKDLIKKLQKRKKYTAAFTNGKKYNYKNFLVSSNKKIHLELLKIIK